MTILRRVLPAAFVALIVATPAHAKKPFQMDVTVAGQSAPTLEFTSVADTVDFLSPESLARLGLDANPDTDQVDALLNFRGLKGVTLGFQQNSGVLTLMVPGLGSVGQQTFGRTCDTTGSIPGDCAAARREALRQVRDFLQSDPAFLKKLLTLLARYSPIDPLAGNPDSLFSRRQRGDFAYGFTNKVSQIWGCGTSAFNYTDDAPIQVAVNGSASDIFRDAQRRAAELQAQNELGLGLGYSTTTAKSTGGDYQTMALEVPISYTAKFDSDPRKKFHVDFPLSYSDTDGAKSYSVGLGFAYTHPLSDVWTLTPSLGVGATASEDLGSGGGVLAYSLTSAYTWRLGGFALSMGNGLGRYSSLALKIGDVKAEADIKNTVFTNGFLLTGPSGLIAKNWVMEYSITDTRIQGDQVYTDNYDEFMVALGHLRTEMGIIDSYTKFGLSYLLAKGSIDDISSLRLVLSSRF